MGYDRRLCADVLAAFIGAVKTSLARGVPTREAIAIETLAERLTAEREQAQATYVSDMVFGAWARKS